MKSTELKPTKENLIESFKNNSIGRNQDITSFVDILNSIDGAFSIAIDANWGNGKTFFIKQTKLVLDAYNEFTSAITEDNKKEIEKTCLQHSTNRNINVIPHVTVYYDAWENDSDDDPILSLIYTIVNSVGEDFSTSNISLYSKKASEILEFFTQKNWSGIIESFSSEKPLQSISNRKDFENDIANFLDALLNEKGDRLVIFIDELDRCSPNFAVKLLERVKHYFSNDRITFVFSINSKELQHTIKRHYGAEFDAYRYLDRFFDLRIPLPEVNIELFYQSIGFYDEGYLYNRTCKAVIETYVFGMREISRYLSITDKAVYNLTHNGTKYNINETKLWCMRLIIPIMVGLYFYDNKKYNDFIEGNDVNPLLIIAEQVQPMLGDFLSSNQTFNSTEISKIKVSSGDKLTEIYNAIFKTKYVGTTYEKRIGLHTFNSDIKTLLLSMSSLFSKYSNYTEE